MEGEDAAREERLLEDAERRAHVLAEHSHSQLLVAAPCATKFRRYWGALLCQNGSYTPHSEKLQKGFMHL